MVLGKRWVLKKHFIGLPKIEDFELVEEEVGELDDREILFKSEFLSVDPYQRPFSQQFSPPMTMLGSSVVLVQDSKHPDYPTGSRAVIYGGWVEVGKINPDSDSRNIPAPPIEGLSNSLLLGACGMPGNTSYFGLLEICQPKAGETVVVSGAAGAVGSLVGQIAKLKGCKVIGFAGSDAKVSWLKTLGFDHAFNYKTCSVGESLASAAPQGVDCYFDNVGGEMTAAVIACMNSRGRVAVCGAISHYNDEGGFSKVTDALPHTIFKELKVEGFIVYRWKERWLEGISQMAEWIKADKLKVQETIVEGFHKTPEAFIGLFTGANTGKMVVKL